MALHQQRLTWQKKIAIYGQVILYTVAGINHFLKPDMYSSIVPPAFPAFASVYVSGVAEIIGGVLLIFPATRRVGGIWLIVLLVAVFPANIFMAYKYLKLGHPQAWLTVLRLPVQPILIWLAWWSTRKRVKNLNA